MKALIFGICIVFMMAGITYAHEIYGIVTPAEGKIEVRCPRNNESADIDSDGSYALRVDEGGECEITVNQNDHETEALSINIYRPRVRVDLRIKKKGKKFILVRE